MIARMVPYRSGNTRFRFPALKAEQKGSVLLSDGNHPVGTVNSDELTCGDALGGSRHADDRRDTVLASDDCAVRDRAAHLHYQAAGGQEEWRPAGISGWRDQNLTRLQVSSGGIEDDPRAACYPSWRGGRPPQRLSRSSLFCHCWGRLCAIGEEDARHVAALQFVCIGHLPLSNDGAHIRTTQDRMRLLKRQEEDICAVFQAPVPGQLLPN